MWLAKARYDTIVYLMQFEVSRKMIRAFRFIVAPFVSILERTRGTRVLSSRVLSDVEILELSHLQNLTPNTMEVSKDQQYRLRHPRS
jgi:hypothetical protein